MVDYLAAGDILNHMVQDRSPALDRVFHALAHPARRSMVRRLAEGERTLSELAAPLKMSFPAASKHVRVLESARLVRRRIVGRTHVCRINSEPLRHASDWTQAYRALWEDRLDRLDSYLKELDPNAKEHRDERA
jgi:DNA-binding transcriptional ArsR family regulator